MQNKKGNIAFYIIYFFKCCRSSRVATDVDLSTKYGLFGAVVDFFVDLGFVVDFLWTTTFFCGIYFTLKNIRYFL